ncbi:hypothetical protein MFLAVUS_000324 [Mucor flavus]|uniref:Uncharacterized protein n=1 Tax=Mucor flavus TaxID=439312 RepID=A0ABP9YJE4_9FUNG
MKFTSILFVATLVLAVSAAPCKNKSHKHPKNKAPKHISYEDYEINNNYHSVDNSSNDVKTISQSKGADNSSSDKSLLGGVAIGKTENHSTNTQIANIS